MYKIFAIVAGKEKPMFVTTLTQREYDEMGEFGIEHLVSDWCEKKSYSYIDFAIGE